MKEKKQLMIGKVALPHRVILAPMAGVTDLPFRCICREKGAGLLCMEMVSAKAILYKNRNTEELLQIAPQEHPVSLQLFGSDPQIVSEMARQIEDRPFDILDLNMGCPVPKVVNNGEGSALMKDPALVEQLISRTVRAIQKPVTVKIRKGFDEEHINAVEIARIAEASGAAAIAVHGRTREQYYSGSADWEIIARVKEAVSIPVIGNGDVTDGPSAADMIAKTGCDGVMVGRAVRGNPWLLGRIAVYLETGQMPPEPSVSEVRNTILAHAAGLLQCKGEYTAVREMRKHISWYTAGYPNSAKFRQKINAMETMEELEESIRFLLGEREEKQEG